MNYCAAQATDPKIVEAANKEGGEIEAYVTLRTDTAQYIWQMFAAKYPFVKVKQDKTDSDKMLQRLATEYPAKKYFVDVLNFGGGFHKSRRTFGQRAALAGAQQCRRARSRFKEINADKFYLYRWKRCRPTFENIWKSIEHVSASNRAGGQWARQRKDRKPVM